MTDLDLSIHFERWHSGTNQYKKYRMNHRKMVQRNGQVSYYDHRVNWAWLAFKGSYNYFTNIG